MKLSNLWKMGILAIFLSLNFAGVIAQEQLVTFKLKDSTLRELFSSIEKQTSYRFAYRNVFLDERRDINITADDMPVSSVLKIAFTGRNLNFSIISKKSIVISSKSNISNSNNKSDVKGRVTDESGEGMVGVSVIVKNTPNGTVTDIDGNFELQVESENDVLVFSYIGFTAQEVVVSGKKFLTIKLEEDRRILEEVVVVGYGTQKKVNLTGAVSTISKRELNERPVSSLTHALKGIDPSLYIKMNSGVQDSGYDVDIRGSISVNGGTPLILVDGVESNLNAVNPNDVESISVLKDASSAAIYGAKASAGVVIVTTKSGKQGEKKHTSVNYNGRMGWKQSTTSTDFNTSGYYSVLIADTFYKQRYGMNYTDYTEDEYQMLWDRRNDKNEYAERPWIITKEDGTYRYYANTDWYGYLWRRTMPQNEHNISVTGGNDRVNYYVSGRYYHDEGMFRLTPDIYNTYSFRSKLDINIFSWLKYHNNVNYFMSENDFNGYSDRNKTYYLTRVHGLASFPATNPDGSAVYLSNHSNTSSTLGDGVMAALINGKHRNVNKDKYMVIGNQLDVAISNDLTLIVSHSILSRNRKYANRCVNVPYSTKAGEIQLLDTGQFTNNYGEHHYAMSDNNYNIYGTYNHGWDKSHYLTVVGGWQHEVYESSNLSVKRKDLLSDELDAFSIATGELETLTQTISEWSTLGVFGRVNYDYKGKYLLEASMRYDGSSRFQSENRWGFFPAMSMGWRISEERFWEPAKKIIDNLKVRYSIGSLGNQQVDYYSFVDQISTDGVLEDYSINGVTKVRYAYESDPKASDARWETITTYNLGLDMHFLNSRLSLVADVYTRDTKDMLTTSLTLPAVYGAASPKSNCADLQTKGWEIKLTWSDKCRLANKTLNYSISGSLGDYKTKITKYNNPAKKLTDYYEGKTLGEIWGYHIDGLFASDAEAAAYTSVVNMDRVNATLLASSVDNYYRGGDLKYVDLDGDNIISEGGGTVDNSGDQRVIGNSLPRFLYSFGANASWNNIDFSILFTGVGRQHWYPTTEAEMFWFAFSRPYSTYMDKDLLSKCWTEDNTGAYFPRVRGYQSFDGQLSFANDRYLQNIAHCRLKNITIGYSLPVLRNVFQRMRVYVSGENLLYWSPLKKNTKFIDPEQAIATSQYKSGSAQAYGFTKNFSVGLDITF